MKPRHKANMADKTLGATSAVLTGLGVNSVFNAVAPNSTLAAVSLTLLFGIPAALTVYNAVKQHSADYSWLRFNPIPS